jgi:hypothetical protein
VVLLVGSASAQVTETWSLPYPGPVSYTSPNAIHIDSQGRVLMAGFTPSGTDFAAFLVAFDVQGTQLWSRTFTDAFGTGSFVDLAETASGRIIALDLYTLVSYDASGTFLWSAAPSVQAASYLRSLSVDAAGNAYIVGLVWSGPTTTTAPDILVQKYSPTGTLLATAVWGGPANESDQPYDCVLDAQGNLYVGGQSDQQTNAAWTLLKLDPALNVLWSRTFTASNTQMPRAMACGASGEVYVASSLSNPGGGVKFGVQRFEPNGSLTWTDTPTDANHVFGYAADIAIDPQGNVVAAGGWGSSDGLVRKYAPDGTVLWSRSYGGPSHDTFGGLAIDAGGDILVGEGSTPPQPGASTTSVLRYDRDGHLVFEHVIGDSQAFPPRLAAGQGTTAFVANFAQASTGGYAVLRRLDPDVTPFCFGDGSGTACPCGNASTAADRSGCVNSVGTAGRLGHDGYASLANDSLVLVGTGMTNSNALYFQGTSTQSGGAGLVFGDGLRCTGSSVRRLHSELNAGGASQYPGVGNASVSVTGGVASPGVRFYQVLYRNAAAFCTADTFNLTNGLQVSWTP